MWVDLEVIVALLITRLSLDFSGFQTLVACKDKDKDKDKDLFIGQQEFVVGYSKAPEQPQSSARPMCRSHTMTNTGHEPTTSIAAYTSSPRYALRHGRRHYCTIIMLDIFAEWIKWECSSQSREYPIQIDYYLLGQHLVMYESVTL